MSANKATERAVEAMAEALRDEPIPELPWDAMEQRLAARLAQEERASARPSPRTRAPMRIAFGLAAAAAVALAVGFGVHPGESGRAEAPVRWRAAETVALLSGEGGERDLSSLRPGEGIEAGEFPLTLSQRGVVRVTLEPGSQLVVRVAGGPGAPVVVELARGALHAEVTPRASSSALIESFAVDVGRTRVAAHGTAFRVTREADEVLVDLEHGAVAVGPAGRAGETTGRLLVGRTRAAFSLDGGKSARMLPVEDTPAPPAPPVTVAAPAPAPTLAQHEGSSEQNHPERAPVAPIPAPQPPAPAPVAVGPENAPAPAPVPTVEAPEPARILSRASVQDALRRCFESQHASSDDSVRVSVKGTLDLSLGADGVVSTLHFDPPLEPTVQSCVFGAVRGGRFPDAPGNVTVPFQLGK